MAGSAASTAALDRLRSLSKTDNAAAVRGAAQQFEALLLDMMLKSMRAATGQDSYFDNDQTKLFQSMLDQSYAQAISARGIGLADLIARQLSAGSAPAALPQRAPQADAPAAAPADVPATAPADAPRVPGAQPRSDATGAVRDFVDRMWPHALRASRETGIPAHFILGQAALESGWGRAEIRAADGTPSHNLFGIKAGRGWSGASVEAATTEFAGGAAQKRVERFRAYDSYEASFLDYARLLKSQPRYAAVLDAGQDASAFAGGLQRAGYATDPMYASKLVRIINGEALRAGLAGNQV